MNWTETQSRTLAALMDRIIPADDFPSASQNGVGHFIRHILETDMRHRAEEAALGLSALNDEAMLRHAKPFADLSAQEQDAMLTAIETGQPLRALWPMSASRFFQLMTALTQEGYYADPGNGANCDRASWKMIGFDPRLPAQPAAEHWLEKKS